MRNKFDWNDVALVQQYTTIESRKEIDNRYGGKLPLFTAPMDMVLDSKNADVFHQSGLNLTLPRNVKFTELMNNDYFYSYGLDDIINDINNGVVIPSKILLDVANGAMKRVFDTVKFIKERFPECEIMAGNIANPDLYRLYCEHGIDYVRVGIGGGSACTTSANGGIHYPMASLIYEMSNVRRDLKDKYQNPTKIVADGGFRNFDEIIKALALGADYVMIGGVLSKCFEACSPNYVVENGEFVPIGVNIDTNGRELYKYYRGMSTKEVQRSWNKENLKTSEGISKFNRVEYTLQQWVDNFDSYLRTAMSYTNSRDLQNFIGETQFIKMTPSAFNRYHK